MFLIENASNVIGQYNALISFVRHNNFNMVMYLINLGLKKKTQ